MTDKFLSISRKSYSDIVKLRREFHRYPELAFQEINTAKIIANEPKDLDIIVSSLENIISRMRNPLESSALTIGPIHGGSATNAIPDEAKPSGSFRAMNEKWRNAGLNLIRRTAEATARRLGGKCKVEISRGYPALVNREEETELAMKSAEKIFGKKSVMNLDTVMTAEDSAFFLQKVPGTFWWIGARNKKTGSTALIHNSKFKIYENVLMYGTATLAVLSLEYLTARGQ